MKEPLGVLVATQHRRPYLVHSNSTGNFKHSKSSPAALARLAARNGATEVQRSPNPSSTPGGHHHQLHRAPTSRHASIGQSRQQRSFASHYYTSSYPSLHALFCGDALMRNGDVIAKRSRDHGKGLQLVRSQTTNEHNPEQQQQQTVRFPWRHCGGSTPVEQHNNDSDVGSVKQTRVSRVQKTPGPCREAADDDARSAEAFQAINQPDVITTESTTKESLEGLNPKIDINNNKNNNILGKPSHSSDATPGGNRFRSKSFTSRKSSSAATSKARHRSGNNYVTISPVASLSVRHPSSKQFANPGRVFAPGSKTAGKQGTHSDLQSTKPQQNERRYRIAFAKSYSAHFQSAEEQRKRSTKASISSRGFKLRSEEKPNGSLNSTDASDDLENVTPDDTEPTKVPATTIDKKIPTSRHTLHRPFTAACHPFSFTRRPTTAALSPRQRLLADGEIDAALLYKEHLKPGPRKNFLSPDQLVVRESVEKVQRWIRTLPRHFDTIHHVLPPVRQDY